MRAMKLSSNNKLKTVLKHFDEDEIVWVSFVHNKDFNGVVKELLYTLPDIMLEAIVESIEFTYYNYPEINCWCTSEMTEKAAWEMKEKFDSDEEYERDREMEDEREKWLFE